MSAEYSLLPLGRTLNVAGPGAVSGLGGLVSCPTGPGCLTIIDYGTPVLLLSLGSFLVVESMRKGMSPKDAGMTALKRVAALTVEKRLLNDRGQPNFNLNYYVLNTKGEHAAVALYASRYAVCTESGPQTLQAEALFAGTPQG